MRGALDVGGSDDVYRVFLAGRGDEGYELLGQILNSTGPFLSPTNNIVTITHCPTSSGLRRVPGRLCLRCTVCLRRSIIAELPYSTALVPSLKVFALSGYWRRKVFVFLVKSMTA